MALPVFPVSPKRPRRAQMGHCLEPQELPTETLSSTARDCSWTPGTFLLWEISGCFPKIHVQPTGLGKGMGRLGKPQRDLLVLRNMGSLWEAALRVRGRSQWPGMTFLARSSGVDKWGPLPNCSLSWSLARLEDIDEPWKQTRKWNKHLDWDDPNCH